MSSQPNKTTNFTTFADWCLHFDSLTKAAKHTVEMLLKRAGTSDCNEADRILSNLTSLTLECNRITDISPLIALTNVTKLHLNRNPITDISPLIALTNLTELNLFHNQIADISPLIALTNLTKLNLRFNQIADISPLNALTNLTYLYLDNNQIADISPLSALTNLTELNLDNNQIADLSPLQSLDQLNYVRIYGVDLPKKYFCSLHQWQAQWLLEEDNAEIRQLLIQVIGYDRICQELQATELDSWREYTLLEIDLFNEIYYKEYEYDEIDRMKLIGRKTNIHLDFSKNYPLWRAECPPHKNYWRDLCDDIYSACIDDYMAEEEEYEYNKIYRKQNKETIYLLEMICPSTGHIHALRVPPDMKSAREAIRWVNWDIDPEEFAVQT